MVLGQGSNFNNPGHAINFQIYMYGYADGTHTVEFNNSQADERRDLRAVRATWCGTTRRGINGAVAASTVEFKNTASFAWAGGGGAVRPVGAAHRHGLGLLPDGVDRVPPDPDGDVRPRVRLLTPADRALA